MSLSDKADDVRYSVILLTISTLLCVTGCVSRSPAANTATGMLGDWSPVGSQRITRQNQFVFGSHYQLYVGQVPAGLQTDEREDLNRTVSIELARYLRRYFADVERADAAESLGEALDNAASAGADILLMPRMESWPTIDPVRVHQCKDAKGKEELKLSPCNSDDDESAQGELAFSVAVYDVRARHQVDAVSAHGQRGAAAYLYERTLEELQELCNAIAAQMAPHGGGR